jgi:hypothetical protein
MSAMRRVAAALICIFALAGCGGGGSTTATGTSSGAEIAPADAIAFVSIDTDRSSAQWQQADALLKKFPGRAQLLSSLESKSGGVNFRRDIVPLLGKEVDIVAVTDASGHVHGVGMTQPTDEQKFDAALENGTNPAVHQRVGDWTVFGAKQEDLDAFTSAAKNGKLADDGRFKDAMDELPDAANAKVYVNGSRAIAALKASLPQVSQLPAGTLDWLSVAISSQSDGVKLDGAAKSSQSGNAKTFSPTLLDKVPAGSLVVVSFRGVDRTLKQVEKSPSLGNLTQLESLLGIKISDLEHLLSGEGVLYVQKGSPFPEVTALVKQDDPTKAKATLDQFSARISALLNGRLTQVGSVKKLSLGRAAIYFGIDGGNLVISDSRAPFGRSVSTPLTSDSAFKEAKSAAGLPGQASGFVYLNIQDTIPVVEGFLQAAGSSIPPNVSQNLAPLHSFLAYSTSADNLTKFSGKLLIR